MNKPEGNNCTANTLSAVKGILTIPHKRVTKCAHVMESQADTELSFHMADPTCITINGSSPFP